MLTHLGDISIATFLKDYWQQKPLLIRQAFPGFEAPLSADELAGLAQEEAVESRIIIENSADHKDGHWQLKCGPFSDDDFNALPENHWTLLVQAVDHYVPEVSALLDEFRFIPNWRLDDLMISYAPDGGSVGPHFDYYDVFLLQAEGKRRWQTGQTCNASSPRLTGTQLSILAEFDSEANWVLEPGDMLYLPPQLAHWGVAEGDGCMTYSIGFRAPSHADILGDLSEDIGSRLSNDQRYRDPGLVQAENPGEISIAAVQQIQAILKEHLDNPAALTDWLGRYMTESKYELEANPEQSPEWLTQDWLDTVKNGYAIERNLSARFAYHIVDQSNPQGQVHLYVNGVTYGCDLELAQLLCGQTHFDGDDLFGLIDAQHNIITELLNRGGLMIEDDEDGEYEQD